MGLKNNLGNLDYPAYTTGQAADLLGVQQAFPRSLDSADLLRPQRSDGGHRRYCRRQLDLAVRIRTLFDEDHTLAAAARIIGLEDELAALRVLNFSDDRVGLVNGAWPAASAA